MSDVKLVGGADYLRAFGLAARGASKIVLQPPDVVATDIQGGITDIVNAIVILGVNFKTDGIPDGVINR